MAPRMRSRCGEDDRTRIAQIRKWAGLDPNHVTVDQIERMRIDPSDRVLMLLDCMGPSGANSFAADVVADAFRAAAGASAAATRCTGWSAAARRGCAENAGLYAAMAVERGSAFGSIAAAVIAMAAAERIAQPHWYPANRHDEGDAGYWQEMSWSEVARRAGVALRA